MPSEYCHIGDSEQNVSDKFYHTCANLVGRGLSLDEATTSVIMVANGMFGRKWKEYNEDKEIIDRDTTPGKKHIWEKLRKIETNSLSLMVKMMEKEKSDGRMVTMASDSTTRRGLGLFQGQGLHIGTGTAFPFHYSALSQRHEKMLQSILERDWIFLQSVVEILLKAEQVS